MKFRVVINGVSQTMASFLQVERGIIDMNKLGAWNQVIRTFHKIEKRIFDTEGGSGKHGRWQPVGAAYAVQKFRRWRSVRILRASDDMRKSLTSQSAHSFIDKQPQELAIGTTLFYAGVHQTGPPQTKYARRSIDLTADDEKALVDPLKQKVRQLIMNARLRDVRGF